MEGSGEGKRDERRGNEGSEKEEQKLMLGKEKLKILAKLVHQQEVNRILSVKFKSEAQRVMYVQDSKETYKSAVSLIDEADELQNKYCDVQPTNVAKKYYDVVEYTVGTAIRMVYNLHLRKLYLEKIRDHAKSLVPEIKDIYERLGTQPPAVFEAEAKVLTEKLVAYKQVQYDVMLKYKNPSSRNFARALHSKGVTYEQMVKKYQAKVVSKKGSEYGKPFEQLDDGQKIEVYDEIIESSGRGSVLKKGVVLLLDGAAKALLVITLGLMVWDIYSSNHKWETAAKDGVELATTIAAGFAGEFIGAAVGTAIAGSTVGVASATAVGAFFGCEAAAVSSAFVCLAAAATGLGAAILVGVAVGALLSWIFNTGGEHASKVVNVQADKHAPIPFKKLTPHATHLHVYVAPSPNAELLARQLAYEGPKPILVETY